VDCVLDTQSDTRDVIASVSVDSMVVVIVEEHKVLDDATLLVMAFSRNCSWLVRLFLCKDSGVFRRRASLSEKNTILIGNIGLCCVLIDRCSSTVVSSVE